MRVREELMDGSQEMEDGKDARSRWQLDASQVSRAVSLS